MSTGASNAVHRAKTRCSILLDLAPGGVCQANGIAAAAGGLLHHRFTLTSRKHNFRPAICLSVALSIGSPRPAVSRHRALRSADFPQFAEANRNHPVNLISKMVTLAKWFVKQGRSSLEMLCLGHAALQDLALCFALKRYSSMLIGNSYF